jgi:hypothetical protein
MDHRLTERPFVSLTQEFPAVNPLFTTSNQIIGGCGPRCDDVC